MSHDHDTLPLTTAEEAVAKVVTRAHESAARRAADDTR